MGLRKVILKALKPFSEISEKELQDDFAQTEEEIEFFFNFNNL